MAKGLDRHRVRQNIAYLLIKKLNKYSKHDKQEGPANATVSAR